jgi:shikimate dehydrogenase
MSVATEHTYTLADLENWPPDRANFPSGGTALAVIGYPIEHSLSPAMQNAALVELTKTDPQFAGWRYYKFKIAPEELPAALAEFHRKKFLGLNLTVPHKVLALQKINLEPQQAFVSAMGAANTIKRTEVGWYAYNTDGPGLVDALRRESDAQNFPEDANVVILGTGGAARAAAVMCLGSCASLQIGGRSAAKLREFIALLKEKSIPWNANSKALGEGFDLAHPPSTLREGSIVINATSLGLKPDDGSPLDLARIPKPVFVYDMIYNPPQTALLRQAAALGIPHANGLSMLVFQGASALKHWTGREAPVSVMMNAARAALAAR